MNSLPKAHGMDGSLVEPDWPPLTLAELRSFLLNFPISERRHASSSRVRARSPRPVSWTRALITEPISASSSSAIIAPCAIAKACLRSIASLRICAPVCALVPRVLASAAGETAIEIGEWTYEVHEIPPGIDLYEDAISWTPFRSAAHAHSAGQALARLHLAAQDFNAPPRKPRPLVASFTIFAAGDPAAEMDALPRRPSFARDTQSRPAHCAEQALELLAPFHAELLAASARAHAALDAQRSARLQSFLERCGSDDATAPPPSSTSASPTAPTPCTISPTPSSATSSSGSLSSTILRAQTSADSSRSS